jgi:transposase
VFVVLYPVVMKDLNQHYSDLLGLDDSWQVDEVDLDLVGNQVVIRLSHTGGLLACPDCGNNCSQADCGPERTWRHLDTMQFKTELKARIPRSRCEDCGVKTIAVSWSGKHSRFTLMFEAFAIRVLQACANVSKAAALLGLSWDSVHRIIERAVQRGLDRRQLEGIKHVGMDEKSFGKGHDYVSVLTDIDNRRVLEVAPERTLEAADSLWETLSETQCAEVESVSMDMWQAFMTSAAQNAPNAEVVHDKFHIAKYLGEAVDKVRRAENKTLKKAGDETLKGSRQLWLYSLENLDEQRQEQLGELQRQDLKTSRAWAIKENFRWFWDYKYAGNAKKFFDRWYGWARRSQLEPIKKVALKLKTHLEGLLSYFRHLVTNATAEGFNSRIQSIKSAARGFRKFENYRIRILFYCGKLDLTPNTCH